MLLHINKYPNERDTHFYKTQTKNSSVVLAVYESRNSLDSVYRIAASCNRTEILWSVNIKCIVFELESLQVTGMRLQDIFLWLSNDVSTHISAHTGCFPGLHFPLITGFLVHSCQPFISVVWEISRWESWKNPQSSPCMRLWDAQ